MELDIKMNFEEDIPEIEDIKRNLTSLYSTRAGTIPMDREFGLDNSFVSKPMPVAQNELALEIVEKTERYEPRVTVESVTYVTDSIIGKMVATVHLEKGEGNDE